MEKIKIEGREYSIIGSKDMKSVIHIGQNLFHLLYLEGKNKKTYNLFVSKDYSWVITDLEGKNLVFGDNFVNLIEDSNISGEFKELILSNF